MAIGTVKFFNVAKGFGFIVPEGGGKDIFVHKTAVETARLPPLVAGQLISYETGHDNQGAPLALNLEIQVANDRHAVAKRQEPDWSPQVATGRGKTGSPASFARTASGRRPAPARQNHSAASWLREYQRYSELAQNAPDLVTREHYLQHAEHFFRMMNDRSDEPDER
jgi:cold shock protein